MEDFVQDLVNGAAAFDLVGFGAIGGVENPKRLAIVGDLDRLAGAGEAFDLERLAEQRAE